MSARSVPVGAHVPSEDPLGAAARLGANCIQLFLGDPNAPKPPPRRPDAEALRTSGLRIYVHAPYLMNPASPKNNIRWQSRTTLAQTCEVAAEIGAAGVVVHAGYAEDDVDEGIRRWTATLEMLETDVPVLIENTAGGDNALARRFDVLARFWDALSRARIDVTYGFCFDTCHAHAAGEDLAGVVERVLGITGRIDLLHCNDSRDPWGSARDRHANLGRGQIDPEMLVAMIRAGAAAGAPVIVETPGSPEDVASDLEFVRAALAGAPLPRP